MTIIYIQGKVDVAQFEQTCRQQHPPQDPKKVIFLFPGNSTHHGNGTTLFSIKSGGGLAVPAGLLGNKGYPVLSLPTTSMERWDTDLGQKKIVEEAIGDLYRAIGAGYSLMLPVRAHENTTYFDNGLQAHWGGVEPSFWGGIQTTANKALANHYITALNTLANFVDLSDEDKQKQAQADATNLYYAAYLDGLQMKDNHPWLKPIIQYSSTTTVPKASVATPPRDATHQRAATPPKDATPQRATTPPRPATPQRAATPPRPATPPRDATPQRAATPRIIETKTTDNETRAELTLPDNATQKSKPFIPITPRQVPVQQPRSLLNTTPTLPTPVSYRRLYQQDENPLLGARALLNDYTKSDSACLRFFYGHWNRHHVKEVARIVRKIDEGHITSTEQLITGLSKITLVNQCGSLARRIQFLEQQFNDLRKDEVTTEVTKMKI